MRAAVYFLLAALAAAPMLAFGAPAPSAGDLRLEECAAMRRSTAPIDRARLEASFAKETYAPARECLIEAAMRLDIFGRDLLLEGLKDPDPGVRQSAVTGLLRFRSDADTAALLERLRSDADVGVRSRIAGRLHRLKGVKEADLRAAAKDRHPLVRAEAADALGEIEHPAAESLLSEAGEDEAPEVKARAARARAAREKRKAEKDKAEKEKGGKKGGKK